MKAWYTSLSVRERTLVMIAGGLVGIFVLLTFIIQPLISYRTSARADYLNASATYSTVMRAAASPATAGRSDPSGLRSILTRTAARSDVVINRINSEGAQIDLSISNVAAGRLYGWIGLLQTEHNVLVQEAQIRPASDGRTVTARLTVAMGG